VQSPVHPRPHAASPARPAPPDPQLDHQYDEKERYRGRSGFSGKKGTPPLPGSSAEARSSTIFSEPGVPPHAGVPRRTPAPPRDQGASTQERAQSAISPAGTIRGALRYPAFGRLLSALAVSQLGDWLYNLTLVALVYSRALGAVGRRHHRGAGGGRRHHVHHGLRNPDRLAAAGVPRGYPVPHLRRRDSRCSPGPAVRARSTTSLSRARS
jgi:hypothetical protein